MSHSRHGFSVQFNFPVYFTEDVFSTGNQIFLDAIRLRETDRRHRILVVIDRQVAVAHPALCADIDVYSAEHAGHLELAAAPVIVPGGESVKNDLTHTLFVLKHINDARLDRQSFVVVIGGGAVLDMVSFAAALAHRGVRVVRLPTTVLSQADSGIAVKNGVNLFDKKNFAGTFVPPFAVINDSRFLETLEQRDVVGGVSEAIKVALLRDPEFFAFLESNATRIVENDPEVMGAIIRRSADMHLAHICGNGDPFELGSARPLDFGHWAAHKLEALSDHRLRHGEAVAIGMALDICYAVRRGYLDARVSERILRLIERLGLPLWDEAMRMSDVTGGLALLSGLREFREHLGGLLHVTMLRGIGECFEVTEMDEAVVRASIADLSARASRGTTAVVHGGR